ncbi:MAG: MiaB/RimO family radical SAM methylthiotransferase, partial [Gemmatimonadetes bacterium]|nr:MiaB/RimO family radical SAM methylthiotransferase [Gemmatimonadota bacterium]
MNRSDSERLAGGLEEMGLALCAEPVEADVVVLNTCVVRQAPEDAAAGLLGRLKRVKGADPDRFIVVTGCMVGPKFGDLARRFPQVDVWARPGEFAAVLRAVGQRLGVDPGLGPGAPAPRLPGVRALVPVIHGCDKFCAFCIIPYRRGTEVSRPVAEVVREVEQAVERGALDVTLLGQNVDSYGHDLEPRCDLADLLHAVHEVPGLARLRFLTSHPNDMSARIIRAAMDLPKVCECVSLPFQTGDDGMLAKMRRGYTRAEYLGKVAEVRAAMPGVAVTTDVMVGLPGETEEQFVRTVEVLEEVRFDKVHAAAYSERPGTIASRTMADDVGREEKRRRLRELSEVQARIGLEINCALTGQ